MRHTALLQVTLPLLLIMLGSLPSHAHKVRIFAWEDSGIIKTETKFSGGRVAKNAAITVTSKQTNQDLLHGTTDNNGFFSFPIPQAAQENRYDLEIIVNSGDGHKNSWLLNAADYLGLAENIHPPAMTQQKVLQSSQELPTYAVSEKQLIQIIESALDRQLAPIKRSLAEQQGKKTSLQDILGGIGYILGLTGIAAYFKSQKKR